jgi:cytochrome c-type biogenesis protein CcmH/NrfG
MTGWVIMILLTLAVVAGLYPFVRKDKGAFQFLAAALLLALAGYSWQGKPQQPGSPKSAQGPQAVPPDDFAILHPDLLGRFDRSYSWMTLADADRQAGNPHGAAEILQSAVRSNPRSYGLWIAYGYALVAASDGVVSPAATMAFDRASRLAPNHPAPEFFYALALTYPQEIRTQDDLERAAARLQQAEAIWRQQLEEIGPGQPLFRAAIEERLAAFQQARATGTPLRPATPPQAAPGPGANPAAPPGAAGNTATPAPAPAGNSAN